MKNPKNDGRPFQNEIITVATQYQSRGLLRIRKVDPPARVLGTGNFRKVIYLENPFLDFVGTWTERAGRGIFFEAKETGEPKLSILSSGLKRHQIDNMKDWQAAGAVTFLLWRYGETVKIITVPDILEWWRVRQLAHLKFNEIGRALRPGNGFITFDFLAAMRSMWPVLPAETPPKAAS